MPVVDQLGERVPRGTRPDGRQDEDRDDKHVALAFHVEHRTASHGLTSQYALAMSLDDALSEYAAMLRASPHNLLSPSALRDLESRHLPESVAFAKLLPTGPSPQRVLDVGSGGGLPGIVLALSRPDLHVELLEARRKKVEFLQMVVRELDLQVVVHRGRAEDLRRTALASSFDLVTARAVAPMQRLVGWTVPFLSPGGLLYAVKGEQWHEEVESAKEALEVWGASVVATPDELPRLPHAPRSVIVRRDGTRCATTSR